jgi:hypothetical protein
VAFALGIFTSRGINTCSHSQNRLIWRFKFELLTPSQKTSAQPVSAFFDKPIGDCWAGCSATALRKWRGCGLERCTRYGTYRQYSGAGMPTWRLCWQCRTRLTVSPSNQMAGLPTPKFSLIIRAPDAPTDGSPPVGDYAMFAPGWHNSWFPASNAQEAHMERWIVQRPITPSYALSRNSAAAIEEAGNLIRTQSVTQLLPPIWTQ